MDVLLDTFGRVDGLVLYALVALFVVGESAALVAIVMPGELALLAAGVLVAQGRLSLAVVLVVSVVAAIVGHAIGYELGRRYGVRLLSWRPLRRVAPAVDGAAALVARRGASAVFLGRWTNVTRIVVPLLAGAGRMPYGRFTACNVLGGAAWAVAFVGLGAVAGRSVHVLEAQVGHATWWLSVAVVVGVLGTVAWRRVHRRRRRPVDTGAASPDVAPHAPAPHAAAPHTAGPAREAMAPETPPASPRSDPPLLCTVSAPDRRDA